MSEIAAVAFDKDGVIFNSEALYAQALREAVKKCSLHFDEAVFRAMTGLNAEKSRLLILEAVGSQMNGDEFIFEHWLPLFFRKVEEGGLEFCTGVESLIETLSENFPLALVTSDDYEHLLYSFNATRPDLLRYFSVLVTVEDVENPKPNPEPYERAAVLLGVANEKMLVIEDSEYGVRSAIEAGCPTLIYSATEHCNVSQGLQNKACGIICSHREVAKYI
ncbi:MAG: HAD family phosphatase [Cardiobacteriaceae bacterium]|nr:HAD family phosphatase [Cardiobacteriaceae bacterium]